MKALFSLCQTGLLCLLLAACTTSPAATTDDGLVLSNSRLDALYLHPEANFSNIKRVYFEPLVVSYSDKRRSDSLNRRAQDFQFNESEQAIFEQRLQQAFMKSWEQRGWQQSDQAGANVLTVRAVVNELYLNASIKNNADSPNLSLAGESSEMDVLIELIDPQGKTWLRAKDHRKTGIRGGTSVGDLRRVNSVSYWQDAYNSFRSLAASIDRAIPNTP